MSNMVFEHSSTLVERDRERERAFIEFKEKKNCVNKCGNKYAVPKNVFQIYNVLSVISQSRLLHSVDFYIKTSSSMDECHLHVVIT